MTAAQPHTPAMSEPIGPQFRRMASRPQTSKIVAKNVSWLSLPISLICKTHVVNISATDERMGIACCRVLDKIPDDECFVEDNSVSGQRKPEVGPPRKVCRSRRRRHGSKGKFYTETGSDGDDEGDRVETFATANLWGESAAQSTRAQSVTSRFSIFPRLSRTPHASQTWSRSF